MKKKVTLFMTHGMSLKEWDRSGLLNREMAIYESLMDEYSIQIYSYGNVADLAYEKNYPDLKVLIIPYYKRNLTLKNRWHLLKAENRLKESSLIKTNQINGSQAAVLYAKKYSIPLITRCGYLWSTFAERQYSNQQQINEIIEIEKNAFQQAKIGITSSERDRQFVIQRYNLSQDKIKCVPNYVDQRVFYPNYQSRNDGHVLFIGRLAAQKNIDSLIDAFSISRFATRLTIIGSGELEVSLKEKAKTINKKIEFLGVIPNKELVNYLHSATVYILPSLYEGLPKTLLEAMSSRIACLVTNVEGIREFVTHEVNGYLTNTDTISIAKGLDVLLSNSELREKIAKNACEKIENEFSLNSILTIEKTIYQSVLNNRS